MAARIDDPDLDVDASSVLVLRNAGPLGAPGMPEWGQLPIPKKLLQQGVRDMLRISDARMSGTSYGACVLHVAPESFVGGPLALVARRRRDRARHTSPPADAAGRRGRAEPPPRRRGGSRPSPTRAAMAPCSRSTSPRRDQGCDFDYPGARRTDAQIPKFIEGHEGADAMDVPANHFKRAIKAGPLADRPVVQPRQQHLGRDRGRLGLRLAAARHRAFAQRAATWSTASSRR